MEQLLHRTTNESTYYVLQPEIWLLRTTTNSCYSGQLFSEALTRLPVWTTITGPFLTTTCVQS